jgi:hypothetical protein
VAGAAGPRRAAEVLGECSEELAGVGVLRSTQDLVQGPRLDDPPEAHDREPVGYLGDHAEVEGDEQDGGATPVLELAHQAQDLGLNGHVQGRGGLIGDQQVRLAGHGHGDHHPLALPAGGAMGVLVQAAGGVRDLHLLEGGHLRACQR